MSKNCFYCGYELEDHYTFCPICGKDQSKADLNLIEQMEVGFKEKYLDKLEINVSNNEQVEKEFIDSVKNKKDEIENMFTRPMYNKNAAAKNYGGNQNESIRSSHSNVGIISNPSHSNTQNSGGPSSSNVQGSNQNINNIPSMQPIEYKHSNNYSRNVSNRKLSILDDIENDIKNAVLNKKESLSHKKEDLVFITEQLSKGLIDFNLTNSSLILKNNEKILLDMDNITLKEPKSVNVSNRGNIGTTIKITKRTYMHLGGGQSRSISHDELKDIDKGNLIITSQRIIFKGALKTLNINLNKILAIDDFKDGVSIQIENKQKLEYFVGTNKSTLNFNISGRKQSTALYGYIVKAAIIGQIRKL